MLNLMRLEMKKVNIWKYFIYGAVISILLSITLSVIPLIEVQNTQLAYTDLVTIVKSLPTIVFSIVTLVLFIDLIFKEYNNDTIKVLFSYPISRKKIIGAKLLFIGIASFVMRLVVTLIILAMLFILSNFLPLYPEGYIDNVVFISHIVDLPLYLVINTLIMYLPFAIGFIKKSSKLTVFVSILLVSCLYSNSNGFTLSTLMIIPVTIAILAMISIYIFVIRRVENEDV